MSSWIWVAAILAALGYLKGLQGWIYRDRLLHGLAAVCLLFPMVVFLTGRLGVHFLRVLPLLGVAMFVHRYRLGVLVQIKLLWFSTLSLATVLTYYYLLRIAWLPG